MRLLHQLAKIKGKLSSGEKVIWRDEDHIFSDEYNL